MWNSIFRSMLERLVQKGTLTVRMPDGDVFTVGETTVPDVTIHLMDPALPGKLIRNPELAMGEAYMDETLVVADGDIRDLIHLVIRNFQNGSLPWYQRAARNIRIKMRRWDQYIPLARAKENAAHHYDISNDFYFLFLDQDRLYTCSYFKDPSFTLEEAQQAKKTHIGEKLLIKPGMRVLDIGCGWGGLAISLAQDYGAKVTGITLSEEQLAYAQARAEKAGLTDKVEFRLQDYRDVEETYDRIVSVGMLEHVGQPQYKTYFDKLDKCLAPDGVALLHFIGRTSPPGNLSPWFQKYIFPGGYTPALSEVLSKIEHTGLEPADIEVWRTHYDRTLREWLDRFEDNLPAVRELGYDERFIRMWRYYLIASELSLSDMPHVLFQVQLQKHQATVPITRDYLYINGAPRHHSAFRSDLDLPDLEAAE